MLSFPLLSLSRLSWIAGLTTVLCACAPAALYRPTANSTQALPATVAQAPTSYRERDVIWGGQVIAVQNFSDHSDIRIMAYPLDSSQRPELKQAGNAYFVAVFPGYIEALQYPAGTLLTVAGRIVGGRQGEDRLAGKILPLVSVAESHRWLQSEL